MHIFFLEHKTVEKREDSEKHLRWRHQGRKGEKAQRQNGEATAGNIKPAHDDVLSDIFCSNINFRIKKKKRFSVLEKAVTFTGIFS